MEKPLHYDNRADVVAFMSENLGTGIITIHVANHPEIDVDGGTATGSWVFECVQESNHSSPRSRPGGAWAEGTLAVHESQEGWCSYCLAVDGTRVLWPCGPAWVASMYGPGPVLSDLRERAAKPPGCGDPPGAGTGARPRHRPRTEVARLHRCCPGRGDPRHVHRSGARSPGKQPSPGGVEYRRRRYRRPRSGYRCSGRC